MKTAMHEESRVSSAIFVCDNLQNFNKGFTQVAVAQWAGHGSKGYFSLNDFHAWGACNEQNSKEIAITGIAGRL